MQKGRGLRSPTVERTAVNARRTAHFVGDVALLAREANPTLLGFHHRGPSGRAPEQVPHEVTAG
ncbi:MAG: hypothetical protein RL077_4562 [Verrucomicrobiota bacterium]|jgi:hypothetical protein